MKNAAKRIFSCKNRCRYSRKRATFCRDFADRPSWPGARRRCSPVLTFPELRNAQRRGAPLELGRRRLRLPARLRGPDERLRRVGGPAPLAAGHRGSRARRRRSGPGAARKRRGAWGIHALPGLQIIRDLLHYICTSNFWG